MRCLGYTKKFKRCNNSVGKRWWYPFCHVHIMQPIPLLIAVIGLIGSIASIQGGWFRKDSLAEQISVLRSQLDNINSRVEVLARDLSQKELMLPVGIPPTAKESIDFAHKSVAINRTSNAKYQLEENTINIEAEYSIRPVKGKHSIFEFIPTINMPNITIEDETKEIAFYFNSDKLITLVEGLPEGSVDTIDMEPGRELKMLIGNTEMDSLPESLVVICPKNATSSGNTLVWNPPQEGVGNYEYLLVMQRQKVSFEFLYTDLKDGQLRRTALLHTKNSSPWFIARVYRFRIIPVLTEDIKCEIRRYKDIQSTFYLSGISMRLRNISGYNLAIDRLSSIQMSNKINNAILNFIHKLRDEELKVFNFHVGEKIRIKMNSEHINFFYIPQEAIVKDGILKWRAQKKHIGQDMYIVLNTNKWVDYMGIGVGPIRVSKNFPGIFSVIRIRVVK